MAFDINEFNEDQRRLKEDPNYVSVYVIKEEAQTVFTNSKFSREEYEASLDEDEEIVEKPQKPMISIKDVVAPFDQSLAQTVSSKVNSLNPGTKSSVISPPRTGNKALYAKYTMQNTSSQCYFCDAESTHNHYMPPMNMVKSKSPYGDMKLIRVCPRCLGRCSSMITANFDELCAHFERIKAGDVVRGRPKSEKLVTVEISKIDIVSNSRGILDIVRVELLNGRYTVLIP